AKLAEKFAPEMLGGADQQAKKAEAALGAGRLVEASDAYREARWLLPAVPADFPEHVARVFGNPRMRHADRIDDLSFTADGSRLATASRDGIVKIWDIASGRELRCFRASAEEVQAINAVIAAAPKRAVRKVVAVAYRPDGKMVACAAGKDIKLFDPDTGKE